ncbi:hypothetical protein BCJMU51_0818 [Bacillus cereus]|uniref:hypothetical protein n=1 Tax=Bacillus cereus group TaxID=86661 RepID=UPI000A7A181E|nr:MULTISPECIES: hypothetical protein [Bacillus cereus group]MED1216037.1 hypothetical protein [Bacillus paranthracis]BCB35952.1 hypothetical protein BCM0045_0847 [Bacillus cereus]BCB98763.1 hypothetical protein BCM0057_0846 [Bacillus cereus]BCC22256.1 hypothetical protein BCM0079_0849 [Bacillus cereus]BCC33866.1 hypothetical protein BCM0105_0856 [Bacillus cereus]
MGFRSKHVKESPKITDRSLKQWFTLTRHLQDGDSVDVSWPIPKYNIYPKGE